MLCYRNHEQVSREESSIALIFAAESNTLL